MEAVDLFDAVASNETSGNSLELDDGEDRQVLTHALVGQRSAVEVARVLDPIYAAHLISHIECLTENIYKE